MDLTRSNTRLPVAFFAAVLCAYAATAFGQAGDQEQDALSPNDDTFHVSGTESFTAEYVGDNGSVGENVYGEDDDYAIFRNSLYLRANNKKLDTAIRLDATAFQNPPYHVDPDSFVPGGSGYTILNYDNDLRIERMHGTVTMGGLSITAGDFYVNFGRGIALSLIKLDDVGVDNSLRGARAEYRIPRSLRLILVGGVVNSINTDTITRQVLRDDPLDRIAGARVEWEIGDALLLGVHGVVMKPRFADDAEIDPSRLNVDRGPGVEAMNAGASGEMHLGGAYVYIEGDAQRHDNYRPEGGRPDVLDEKGYAAFAEISYDLSPFNVKAEGLHYRRWLMEGPLRGSSTNIGTTQPISYNHMVTLEPMWMPIRSFGNASGGRLTGDLYLSGIRLQLKAAGALIKYEGGLLQSGEWTDHPPTLVVHPTVEARKELGDAPVNVALSGGYRHEVETEGYDRSGDLWHAMGDVTVPISGPHSVEVKAEIRRHMLDLTEGYDYWVAMVGLGYDLSGLFGATAAYEYSDQTAGNDAKIFDWTLPFPEKHYVWAMLTVHAPAPLDGLDVRLIGGSQRGGIKCAGGVCRNYPDSVGARVEAVYRF